jgi:glutamine synthetase
MGAAVRTVDTLDAAVLESAGISSREELSVFCRDRILATMNELRVCVDEMETLTGAEYWPYPSYGELLFSIR